MRQQQVIRSSSSSRWHSQWLAPWWLPGPPRHAHVNGERQEGDEGHSAAWWAGGASGASKARVLKYGTAEASTHGEAGWVWRWGQHLPTQT